MNNDIVYTGPVKSLLQKISFDFQNKITAESDILNIVLKGHLFMEYHLNHLLLLHEDLNLDDLTFDQKLKKAEEWIPPKYFRCLNKLNKLRNNLSHQLDFKISESEIDSIGFCLGRDYILEKYKIGMTEPDHHQQLLVWVLLQLVAGITYPIYQKIIEELPEPDLLDRPSSSNVNDKK